MTLEMVPALLEYLEDGGTLELDEWVSAATLDPSKQPPPGEYSCNPKVRVGNPAVEAWARKVVTDSWAALYPGGKPSLGTLQIMQALGRHEGSYGKAAKPAGWAETKNWGAVQCCLPKDGGCPSGSKLFEDYNAKTGKTYAVCFKAYATDLDACKDMIAHAAGSKSAKLALANANIPAVAKAMYEAHYYGGFTKDPVKAIACYAKVLYAHVQGIAQALGEPIGVSMDVDTSIMGEEGSSGLFAALAIGLGFVAKAMVGHAVGIMVGEAESMGCCGNEWGAPETGARPGIKVTQSPGAAPGWGGTRPKYVQSTSTPATPTSTPGGNGPGGSGPDGDESAPSEESTEEAGRGGHFHGRHRGGYRGGFGWGYGWPVFVEEREYDDTAGSIVPELITGDDVDKKLEEVNNKVNSTEEEFIKALATKKIAVDVFRVWSTFATRWRKFYLKEDAVWVDWSVMGGGRLGAGKVYKEIEEYDKERWDLRKYLKEKSPTSVVGPDEPTPTVGPPDIGLPELGMSFGAGAAIGVVGLLLLMARK